MNKIVIDVIDEEKLEIPSGESEFNFSKDTLINDIVFSNDFNTVWNIWDGVTLDIQSVINIRGVEGIIKIISNNNSNLLFHLGIKATLDNKIELLNNVNGNDCNSEIKVRIISDEDSKILFKATGYLGEKTHNNIYVEDIKYLNEYPASITCLPELIVLSDDVSASHNMSVGSISDEELFYLESRGIKCEVAKEMIKRSFLMSMKRKEAEDE